VATTTLLTLQQFLELPDDDLFHELDQGELIAMPPPQEIHGRMQTRLAAILYQFVSQHHLGDVVTGAGFLLTQDPATVRAPDVAFLRAGHPPVTGTYRQSAPDLAVEIVSPSDTPRDLIRKVNQYLEAGGRAVWLLYPASREIHVFEPNSGPRILTPGQTLDAPEILPGFSVRVEEFFD